MLRERADLPAAQRKLAAQLAEGSPGVALALESGGSRPNCGNRFCRVLAATIERRSSTDLFAQTAQLAKGQKGAV